MALIAFVIAALSCGHVVTAQTRANGDVTPQRLLHADAQPGEWFTGGRDYQQSYYSPLAGINAINVRNLGFAWDYAIDATAPLYATPIVVDGMMFTSGNGGAVYAVDARTGAERWTFKPGIDTDILRKTCCGAVNRGVSVWRGKVYVASLDGYLYSLDAGTGSMRWKVDTIHDRSRAYSSTGAPYIAKDLVIIGNGGADFDARGYITAYNHATGEQVWRFWTVPGNPSAGFEHPELEMAAKTWDPNSLWEVGLGGTAWDGMAYDPELNLLYVGTGNGVPYPRKIRSPAGGDNLFLSSILAINPDNGRLVWHYQTVPGENWDYTATQKMILADLTIGGTVRQVLMQAPKNGFFYVLDRKTGELLSADPFVTVTWASHVDETTGRPVETGQGDYSNEPKLVFPSIWGGHNWPPMAYNVKTGLVYIPTLEGPTVFTLPKERFQYKKAQVNQGFVGIPLTPSGDLPNSAAAKALPPIEVLGARQPDRRPRAFLKAWDPIEQRVVWKVETTRTLDQTPFVSHLSGGVMTTASGLVLQGNQSGRLMIVDAATGAQLHSIDVGGRIVAAPMTYTAGRKQYVAIMTSGDDRGRIVAFRLGGGAVPKRRDIDTSDVRTRKPPINPFGTSEQIALGGQLFQRHCALCHDTGRAPDLSSMNQLAHTEFMAIVLNGQRADKGMGNFSAVLSTGEAEAIHAYLTNLAWDNYRNSQDTTLLRGPH